MKTHEFEAFRERAKKLIKMDTDNLEKDIRDNITALQDFTSIYFSELKVFKKVKTAYDKKYKLKYHELRWNSDEALSYNEIVNIYLKGDEELIKLRKIYEELEEQLEEIKSYIDILKSKQFAIKDYINWRKFISLE